MPDAPDRRRGGGELEAGRVAAIAVPDGAPAAEDWLGYDDAVIRAARETGNEDDYARTLLQKQVISASEVLLSLAD